MKQPKRAKKRLRISKKTSKILVIVLLIILFSLIIFNLVLYTNFKIGNDVLINLKADKEFISVINQQEQNLNFNLKITSNLFCRTTCDSTFKDLSNDKIISSEQINLTSRIPIMKEYEIKTGPGEGIDLYSFNVECRSIQTRLCHTKNGSYIRTIVVPVQHNLSSQEIEAKDYSEDKLKSTLTIMNEIQSNEQGFSLAIRELNKTASIDSLIQQLDDLVLNINATEKNITNLLDLYNNQEYLLLEQELNSSLEVRNLQRKFLAFNESFIGNISLYNALRDNLNSSYANLNELTAMNLTSLPIVSEINSTITEFNSVSLLFLKRNSLSEKESDVNNIKIVIDNLVIKSKDETTSNIPILFNNLIFNLSDKIILNYSMINITLNTPKEKCCVFNECQDCVENSSSNYPIIFIHGHSFSESVDVDNSLNAFDKIQKDLEEEGLYINAGSFSLYHSKDIPEGIFGNFNNPVAMRASYYYDITQTSSEYIFTSDNNENIDSYALRLKDMVESIKIKSGKDKVIIVAHSMGGLVARRYIQLFGEEDVDKLILIGTPNSGVKGKTQTICPLFGGKKECEDMAVNSTFMKKINPQQFNIPVYIIIGQGCAMDYGDGDGITLKENAKLNNAVNYYINGTCTGLDLLHGRMLDPDKVPEVYNTIKEILNN